MRIKTCAVILALCIGATGLRAQGPPCRPCAGIVVESTAGVAAALGAATRLTENERLYVAWPVALDRPAAMAAMQQVAATGATPWLILRFNVPAPLHQHLSALDRQLKVATGIAADAPRNTHFQIDWVAGDGAPATDWRDYGFLLKRASVAIAGVNADAPILTTALPMRSDVIESLYDQDIAAYVRGAIFQPARDDATRSQVLSRLQELDPGKPVTVEGVGPLEQPDAVLVEAARRAAAGVAVTLFRPGSELKTSLRPLAVLARELRPVLHADGRWRGVEFRPREGPGAQGNCVAAATWSHSPGSLLRPRLAISGASRCTNR
jgi:hypothetical protein